MKTVSFHIKVLKEIEKTDFELRTQIFELLGQLSYGEFLGMPVSRPMTSICSGAYELRIKDRTGQYRVFYYLRNHDSILVFHFFKKKTEKTTLHDLKIGKQRLRELL